MSSVILDVLLLCLLFPCIVHFHFIIVLFFYWNLAVFITCYWNIELTYLLTKFGDSNCCGFSRCHVDEQMDTNSGENVTPATAVGFLGNDFFVCFEGSRAWVSCTVDEQCPPGRPTTHRILQTTECWCHWRRCLSIQIWFGFVLSLCEQVTDLLIFFGDLKNDRYAYI